MRSFSPVVLITGASRGIDVLINNAVYQDRETNATLLELDAAALPRAQWRCLRVLSAVGDIAHAARKLHWSQAVLRLMLVDLQAALGVQHVQVCGDRIELSPALKQVMQGQQCPCQPARAEGEPRVIVQTK